jgi:hypothetical protein
VQLLVVSCHGAQGEGHGKALGVRGTGAGATTFGGMSMERSLKDSVLAVSLPQPPHTRALCNLPP